MAKNLAILMTAGGCIFIISFIAFLHIAEVRQWFPVVLLIGGLVAWKGFQKYRDA